MGAGGNRLESTDRVKIRNGVENKRLQSIEEKQIAGFIVFDDIKVLTI